MVAVRSDPHLELPDDLYCDAVGRLVAAGLAAWGQDAARYLKDPGGASDGQAAAWRLIERRPEGCPLIMLAAELTGRSEVEVWRGLCQTAVAQAGLPAYL